MARDVRDAARLGFGFERLRKRAGADSGNRGKYRKVEQRALFGYPQLWAAPDHLLLVQSSRFAENYQRFALADIQAIVVTESRDRLVMQICVAIAAILWTSAALAMQGWFGRGFFLITGALAIVSVLVDILRGPRCRCHLYTARTNGRRASG